MTTRGTVLVTGATGFIGRHLVRTLAASGWRVRASVRRPVLGVVPGIDEVVITGAIHARTEWAQALNGVDSVVHLSALAHQTDPKRQPTENEFMTVNAEGTRGLALAAKTAGIDRVVLVSSIGAVADKSVVQIDESTRPAPVTPYGRSKLAAENALRHALAESSVEWCVVRPVLVYGPGNPGNMARLLKLVRSGCPLPLNGIKNKRSFVFVGNLVGAILQVLDSPAANGQIFHVADDEAVSSAELVRLIGLAADKHARLWSVPTWALKLAARCGDMAAELGVHTGLDSYSLQRLQESLSVSNNRIKSLGWKPQVSLAEGLCLTLGSIKGAHP